MTLKILLVLTNPKYRLLKSTKECGDVTFFFFIWADMDC